MIRPMSLFQKIIAYGSLVFIFIVAGAFAYLFYLILFNPLYVFNSDWFEYLLAVTPYV